MIKEEINKLKEITDELMKVDYALLVKEQQWEIFFKSVPESVFIIDSELNIIYANNELINNLNFDSNEKLIGSNYLSIFKEFNGDKLVSNKIPRFFKCLNGWYSSSISTIEEDGYIMGYVCTLHDNNEIIEIKQKLSKTNDELLRIKKECGMQMSV